MSFGIAGGLEPGLPLGALVLGTEVISVDARYACEAPWIQELSAKIPAAHCGAVWGSEILVATAKDKSSLYKKSRAMIVDMESQCVAQVAAEAKIPFAVVRAVCDGADMDVPAVVMKAINPDGSINFTRTIGHVLLNPSEIPDLIQVGRGTGKALSALRQIVGMI